MQLAPQLAPIAVFRPTPMASFDESLAIEQAYRHVEAGRLFDADIAARRVLKESPRSIQVLRLQAVIASARNDQPAALAFLKKCLALRPKDHLVHWDLARVLTLEGRYDEAMARYDKALKYKPDYLEAITGKADVLERRGDYEAARKLLDPYVQAGTEEIGMAVVFIRIYQRLDQYREGLELAARHLRDENADSLSRRHLLFLSAKAHEALGQYDAAFESYGQMNRCVAQPFDMYSYRENVDELIETFSAQNMPLLPKSGNRSELPIFIACMPRSGSTLVEQIIHAHPHAFGAGEISPLNRMVHDLQSLIGSFQTYPACVADLNIAHLDELSRSYLKEIKRMGRSAIRVVNKHLDNGRHVAMMSLLFPAGRVIHIQREALDNCFACYMAMLSPVQSAWASDLESLGFVYREHERLMQHWREVLDYPILHVKYEDLVEDPERWIRKIIDFCGLEWDDRCLRFHEAKRNVLTLSYDQVRRPIYTSAVKRYEKYEAHLGPLRKALRGEGEAPTD